jgi:carbon monoxide dehydrogenase subunit G
MRTLKRLGTIATTAVGAMLILASMRQDTFHVERSTRIAAPPEWVFQQINDLQRMKYWNPYEQKDPSLKGEFGKTTRGVGASYAFESDKVATGRMTIVQSKPLRQVTLRLDFEKPFVSTVTTEYTLTPDRGGTRVTWTMEGPANFVHKLMDTAFVLDPLIGRDLDQGLSNLKVASESY